ncbi:MAG: glycosyltransferase [bacterium]
MKKLLIVIDSFRIGGITSSLESLVYLIKKNFNYNIYIQVLNNDIVSIDNVHIIRTKKFVEVNYLSLNEARNKDLLTFIIFLFVKSLKTLFGEKPVKYLTFFLTRKSSFDIVVSFANDIYDKHRQVLLTNLYSKLAVKSLKRVGWIHADPQDICITDKIANETYKKFDFIVAVSNFQKSKIASICPSILTKLISIKNFVNCENLIEKSNLSMPFTIDNKVKILTVARVEFKTKALDRIITIVNKLLESNIKNFDWNIIGDGVDFNILKKMVEDHKLENYIHLLGEKSNPYPYMKYSDLFVLPSKFEAFPMVIIESQCLKLPSLITKYPSSIEQISHGINGIIVENNVQDIFEQLLIILSDKKYIRFKKNLMSTTFENDKDSLKNLEIVLRT